MTSSERERLPSVGFIGLGVMGFPMAQNLQRAGYPLAVYSRSGRRDTELVADGARQATSPGDIRASSDVVITMLSDTDAVRSVFRGRSGLLSEARSGGTWIDMSTIDPAVTIALAAEATDTGLQMLDAPVSGGQIGAIEATLSIMVGGPADSFAQHRQLLGVLGKHVLHVGAAGAGQIAKICNQIAVAGALVSLAEGLTLAGRAGVDPRLVCEAMRGGLAGSRVLEVCGPRMLSEDFTPGFRIRLHRKDIGIALDAEEAYGASSFVSRMAAQLMDDLIAAGYGELDHSVLIRALTQPAEFVKQGPWPSS